MITPIVKRFATLTVFLIVMGVVTIGHASDYATEVISYDNTNSGSWPDPQTVLGRPTVDTVGDGYPGGLPPIPVPIVPVYAPYRTSEIFRLGDGGGFVVVKFDQPIQDDPLNPCGIDLIIFGNANQLIGGNQYWQNQDPNTVVIQSSTLMDEPAKVYVSQDGTLGSWVAFETGPYGDTFAPTLGRVYDDVNPEPSLFGNLWWGAPTDATYPLNPNLTSSDFVGKTVAQVAKTYGYSAGGTGFDLADVGLDWIQYVKVVQQPDYGTPEIDAFSDVKAFAFPDLDCDSDVDNDDIAILEDCATGPAAGPPLPGCERADFDGDNDVDQSDFGILQVCFSGPNVLANRDCVN